MERKSPYVVMVEEIKRYCEIQTVAETLRSSHPEYRILESQANFGIATICDVLEMMIIPKDKIHEIIIELEALRRHHAIIRNVIDKLQAYESETTLAEILSEIDGINKEKTKLDIRLGTLQKQLQELCKHPKEHISHSGSSDRCGMCDKILKS